GGVQISDYIKLAADEVNGFVQGRRSERLAAVYPEMFQVVKKPGVMAGFLGLVPGQVLLQLHMIVVQSCAGIAQQGASMFRLVKTLNQVCPIGSAESAALDPVPHDLAILSAIRG